MGFDFPQIEGLEPCIYWFQKAAKQEHKKAQRNLSKDYSMGIATNIDNEKADYWKNKYLE